MAKERQNKLNHVTDIHDEKKQRQLRMEDDEEDFLDESRKQLLDLFHLFNPFRNNKI